MTAIPASAALPVSRARGYQIVLGFATDLSAVRPAGVRHHREIAAAGA